MIVHNFVKAIVRHKIFDIYIAAAFFATLIFFVLNASIFKPLEIVIGVVLVTIAFKGLANIMFAMIISFIEFDKVDEQLEFEETTNRIDSLINDLALKEATVKATKAQQEQE